MTNENERIQNNRTKIEFFMREKIKVHVDKTDKNWLNGFFISKIDDNIYILKDDVLGEQHIFLNEVYKVSNYTAPKNSDGRPKYNNF